VHGALIILEAEEESFWQGSTVCAFGVAHSGKPLAYRCVFIFFLRLRLSLSRKEGVRLRKAGGLPLCAAPEAHATVHGSVTAYGRRPLAYRGRHYFDSEATPRNGGGASCLLRASHGKPEAYRYVLRPRRRNRSTFSVGSADSTCTRGRSLASFCPSMCATARMSPSLQ
jgi:hypothetical protein